MYLSDLLSRCFLDFILVQKDTEQSKIWEHLHPALQEYKSLKVLSPSVLRFFLLDWKKRDYCDVFERDAKVTQNVRYNKTIDLNELQMLAKTPPEMQFLMILCAGFDFQGRSTVKIANFEARLKTINNKLKNTDQPELREVLTKLATNKTFSEELIKVIRDRMDCKAKSALEGSCLPGMPREESALTGPGKNVENEQSNLETFSISDSGGGVISGPAV